MGHSAKITRGGDKTRINQGRQEAKMRAQGTKSHTTSVKDSLNAKQAQKKKSKAIASELRAKSAHTQSGAPIVKMAPKVRKSSE